MTRRKQSQRLVTPVVPQPKVRLRPSAEPDFWDLVEQESNSPEMKELERILNESSRLTPADLMITLG